MRVAALAGGAAGPVATCAGARPRSIEALICGSPLLAALDAEMARVYRLATGPREPVPSRPSATGSGSGIAA